MNLDEKRPFFPPFLAYVSGVFVAFDEILKVNLTWARFVNLLNAVSFIGSIL